VKSEERREKSEEKLDKKVEIKKVSPPSHAMEGTLMPDSAYSWGG
jgi:hypothetical protein